MADALNKREAKIDENHTKYGEKEEQVAERRFRDGQITTPMKFTQKAAADRDETLMGKLANAEEKGQLEEQNGQLRSKLNNHD